MIRVIFKNLEKSDLVRALAIDRVEKTIQKFPEFMGLTSSVTISRQHAHVHGGQQYAVKLLVEGHGVKPVVLEKRAESFYQALALVTDRALELLHRAHDKDRLVRRQKKRKWKEANRWNLDLETWVRRGA